MIPTVASYQSATAASAAREYQTQQRQLMQQQPQPHYSSSLQRRGSTSGGLAGAAAAASGGMAKSRSMANLYGKKKLATLDGFENALPCQWFLVLGCRLSFLLSFLSPYN